tara:strand:- start:249 stop:569 length:321 start_codon:yes stop_codon:yes gene_type:complete
MGKAFKIAPGRFHIPNIGFVDAQKKVSDDKAFAIYKLSRRVFPWIQLGPEAESYLKKQKLVAKDVAQLVQNARTKEEAERLAALSETKTVNGILETKLKSLENNKD